MLSRSSLAFVLLVMLLLLTVVPSFAQDSTPPYRIVGYYSSWSIYDRAYFVTDIPADKLTTINYAFALVSDDAQCVLGDEYADIQYQYPGDKEDEKLLGNFKQLNLLKQAHPGLQTVISIGGWTGSAKFSDAALTAESRQKFVSSCMTFITQYGFDGIDIDWEYPTGGGNTGNVERADDPQNFILLLTEFRKQLDAQGKLDNKHYVLTMAAPAGKESYSGLDWAKIYPLLDWINVMTYDFDGSWSEKTGFNAPLYDSTDNPPEGGSTNATIQDFLAAGIPAQNLVMGVPFYGRGFTGVAATDNGLHQSYTGLPDGSDDGGIDYRNLVDGDLKTAVRYWSDISQVPWLYNAKTGTMISYDDPQSLQAKADYVKKQGLGGMMIWELASDDKSSTLLTALHEALMGS